MALINCPLTEAEVDKMLADYREGFPRIASLWDRLLNETLEPTPHYVRYHRGRVTYTPPELVFIRERPYGPSDCVWIVPGT